MSETSTPTQRPARRPDSRVAAGLARVTAELPGGGEVREGQQQMADAVATAIRQKSHLVVQAGTGTGKSLGYLVPALVTGSKVVVSTATKALQDQLAGKDLPFLKEHLDVPFEFALLKGRSNYFCLQKAEELQQAGAQLGLDGVADDGWASSAKKREAIIDEVTKLAEWATTSPTGDRAELDFEPTPAAWSAVSVAAGECPGAAKCPYGESCFAERARQAAAVADVIVVNTHLYGQHVRANGHILPEHDVVIFDEAHELEDIIADSLGIEISAGRFAFLAGRVRAVITDIDKVVDLVDAGTQIEAALTPFAGQRLLKGPAAVPQIQRALTIAIDRVNKAMAALKTVPDDAAGGAGQRKMRAVQAATSLIEELTAASELGATGVTAGGTRPKPAASSNNNSAAFDNPDDLDDPRYGEPDPEPTLRADEKVAWVEAGQRNRGPVLRIAPIEVGSSLYGAIWSNTTAILASATIPTNLSARVGLPTAGTANLDVGSPFDYATQGLLYCAVHLPDPRSERFEAATHKELEALLRAAGGRTLALFTSWRAMTNAAEAMRSVDPPLPFRILTQSDLPKPALTRAFAEDETSVLFATMGFWQGIDVPGRALSLVVIDKLPFARPDEPLLVARREKAGDAAFRTIDLPRAAMLLAQGTGRLIRSSSDRGVVAVLDPRLNSAKAYRKDLLDALPPMRRTRHLADVQAFLAEIIG